MRIIKRSFLFLLLCIILLSSALPAGAQPARHAYTAAEIDEISGGIAAYKEAACGASSVQEWIDTGLCGDAGATAEFYVIALSQSGSYDLSRYEKALLAYVASNEVYSATTREKYALALLACGCTDSYIRRVCDNDIGGQGLMSLVFGLHLLNNGCTSSLYTSGALISEILSAQLADGGWAVIGSSGDVDVTAMTVQALAPYYGVRSDVTAAADRALSLLSARQLESGGYKSMGKENCESAAQVLVMLSSLGIDQNTDARFIKDGNTVLDAMLGYRSADGSFAHTGSGYNESATVQAFYSLRAYRRMRSGQGPLYLLDRRPATPAPTEPSPAVPTRAAATVSPAPTRAPEPSAAPASEPATEQQAPQEGVTSAPDTAPAEPTHGEYVAPTGSAVFQPAGTAVSATPDEAPAKGGGYKRYAVLGVLAAAGIACAVLLLCKKRGLKHYAAVLILAGAAVAFILLTNFESEGSYRHVEEKTDPAGTVTMTISCGVLAGEDDLPYTVPDDCLILPETTFTLGESETVYDILLEASKRYDIRIDNRGGAGSAYIAGIQYLYEFDYGSLSGWMYRVNGAFPDVGCQAYRLNDGDRIEWLYTKEIGKDLK